MTSSWTAISMWNASSFLLGPFRDQYKCWFLNDLNSIDILYLHNCFQIPPAALWYRSDNENFLGWVTKSSFWKLDNQRGLWTEERLFWGIPLNQLFKLLEGRSHILFLQEQGTKPIHTKTLKASPLTFVQRCKTKKGLRDLRIINVSWQISWKIWVDRASSFEQGGGEVGATLTSV